MPLEQGPETEHEGRAHENQRRHRYSVGSLRAARLPLGCRRRPLGGARLLPAEGFLAGFGPRPLPLLAMEPILGECCFLLAVGLLGKLKTDLFLAVAVKLGQEGLAI